MLTEAYSNKEGKNYELLWWINSKFKTHEHADSVANANIYTTTIPMKLNWTERDTCNYVIEMKEI